MSKVIRFSVHCEVKWSTKSSHCVAPKLFLNKQLTEFILGRPMINNYISGDSADSLIIHHREIFLARNLNEIPWRLVSYSRHCLFHSHKLSNLGKEKNATRPSEYSVWSWLRPRSAEALCDIFKSLFFCWMVISEVLCTLNGWVNLNTCKTITPIDDSSV